MERTINLASMLRTCLVLFALLLAMTALGSNETTLSNSWAAVLAFVGVRAVPVGSALLDVAAGWMPARYATAWWARFTLAAAAVVSALALGWARPEQGLVVSALVVFALWLTYTRARWCKIWLPLIFSPAIIGMALGFDVPAWLIGTPAVLAYAAHWALSWRYQQTLGYFRLGFSDLNLGWGTIAFMIIGFKLVVPVLLTAWVLSLPLVTAVQTRTFGGTYGLNLLALTAALTALTTSAEMLILIWLGWLLFATTLGLILVRVSSTSAVKLIRWKLQPEPTQN